MSFAQPNLLWLLLLFPPALILFFWWSMRQRRELMARFIQTRLLPGLIAGVSPARQKVRFGCLLAGVICVILALARPQWGFVWEEVKQRGVDIVVAIDTSKSMLAEDIAPNRLARAKLAALDLMQQAKSDRLGLVAFAGNAFLQCPLTIDDTAFRQSVESLNVNTLPEGGTALAEAIETAQTAFKEGDNHKVLVLMTDGEDHDSGALEAAQKAAQSGMKIFTIGIGTPEGELLRIKDAQGRPDYIRDEQGNVVKSHLNERLLQEIAGTSPGCFYLPLRGAKTIEMLFEKGLAPLPKSEHQEKLIKQHLDRFHWPLGLAIAFFVMEMLLPERRRKPRTGSTTVPTSVKPRLQSAATVLALLALPTALLGSTTSALREYKSGNYDQALKDYEQALKRNADDPRLHFNAGAAAYRNHQFDEATKQFNDAAASPDLQLQGSAYYNRGNSLYRLGEANADPSKRTETWEKSLKDFELSMKLNPQDPDAKFNHDFVKKQLEELKQQQQQQKQDQKDKPDQDKQEQNQNQQSDQQKDQQQQDQKQSEQNQADQKQSSPQQNQPNSEQQKQPAEKQPQDQKEQGQKDQQEQQQAKQAQGQDQKDEKEKDTAQGTHRAAGQMTTEQAQRLLDAQKGDEKMLPVQPKGKPADRNRPVRDW